MAADILREARSQFLRHAPDSSPSTSPSSLGHVPFSSSDLFTRRAAYQDRALLFLEELVALSSPLMPRPCIFTDYVPAITNMVLIEDVEEERERQVYWDNQANGGKPKGRQTKTSQRAEAGASTPQSAEGAQLSGVDGLAVKAASGYTSRGGLKPGERMARHIGLDDAQLAAVRDTRLL